MRIKKHSFILIEIIISLFLITILLTFLFGYFSKITKIEIEIENIKNEVYKKNNLHIRLNNIFTQLNLKDFDQGRFYSKYEKDSKHLSLYLNYNNGIDPNPNFSEIVKAKLFVDDKNNLLLVIWPKDNKIKTARKEILLTNINKIEYKFLGEKDLQMEKYIIEKIAENSFWYKFWPKEKRILPSVVYIKINKNMDFAFFLQSQDANI